MIDYQKLKLAHELADKYAKENEGVLMDVKVEFGYSVPHFVAQSDGFFERHIWIDDLIAKLQELTKPKPKYSVGDCVWFTWHEEVGEGTIREIDIDSYGQWQAHISNFIIKEHQLYPSRQALIESQIKYWTKLYREDNPGFIGYWDCLQNEEISTGSEDVSMTCTQSITEKSCDKFSTGMKHDRIIPMDEMKPKFEGEFEKFACSDSIRKHHELECEHEHDRHPYAPKCIKCGELC